MTASFREPTAPESRATADKATAATVAATATGTLLLFIGLTGPGWVRVPANPAAKSPEMTLSFGDLRDLFSSGPVPTSSVQDAYFAWLGWVAAVVVVALAVLSVLAAPHLSRLTGALLVAASLAGLFITTLAVKGLQTWGEFFDHIGDSRIGLHLVLAAYLVMAAVGATKTIKRPR